MKAAVKMQPRRGTKARDELVLENQGLVYLLAIKWCRSRTPWLTAEEVSLAGQLGLIRAASLWDETRAIKFTSYAGRAIWRAISLEHGPNWNNTRVLPESQMMAGSPPLATIAVGPDDADASDDESDRAATIRAALGMLESVTPRHREVIERCFGLNGKHRATMVAIGRDMGVCKERVRQLKESGFGQIREMAAGRGGAA